MDDIRHMTGGQIFGKILPSEYWSGGFSGSVPRDRWKPLLWELRLGLSRLTEILRAVPPPSLQFHKPPTFARLHDHAEATALADQLAELLAGGGLRYQLVAECRVSSSFEPDWDDRCRAALGDFLTTEVSKRYAAATDGLQDMEVLASHHQKYPGYDYGQLSPLIQRIHAAYIAIALNYLTEVLELMPKYAEDSGQGKRRGPVTVYGSVGMIHSEMTIDLFVSSVGVLGGWSGRCGRERTMAVVGCG
jgi:hypothetical protein